MTFHTKLSWEAKSLRIRFDVIYGFINIYDGIRYLVLFGFELYDAIYKRFRYRIGKKSSSTDSINHNFARVRIDSYNFLPIEKALIFHNVIIML